MVDEEKEQDPKSQRRPKFVWGWLIGLVAVAGAVFYFYYQYHKGQEALLNSHYFRALGEVASELNARLGQFEKLHNDGQPDATIRAILPSYEPEPNQVTETIEPEIQNSDNYKSFLFTAAGNKVALWLETKCEKGEGWEKVATVEIDDVLPIPRDDFSSYLLVDAKDNVLGSTGGQRGFSMVDTNDLSEKIWEEKTRDWAAIGTGAEEVARPSDFSLPGYSYQTDMNLASGRARMFVLPFKVGVTFFLEAEPAGCDANRDSRNSNGNTADYLYLVGALPESFLNQKDDRRWQVGLVLLTLIALGFIWTALRLGMLSGNQPVGDVFYAAVLFFSYSLFILSVALLFSWGEQRAEVEHKHTLARELLWNVGDDFRDDLAEILRDLEPFRGYYIELLEYVHEASNDAVSGAESAGSGRTQAAQQSNDGCWEYVQAIDKVRPPSGEAISEQLRLTLLPEQSEQIVGGILLSDGTRWILGANGCYERFELPCEVNESAAESDDNGSEDSADGKRPIDLISLYGEGVNYAETEACGVWFNTNTGSYEDLETTQSNTLAGIVPGNILNVFLMNESGQQILPSFYYVERSQQPAKYNLSHREYFKEVRDHHDWKIPKSVPRKEGRIYIQRLLNLNTGTRGTTLGMELIDRDKEIVSHEKFRSMTIGSDITLPSMTFVFDYQKRLLDLNVMVVDQASGDVLYHFDESRSMVENLFHAGRGADAVSQRISLGRGTQPREKPKDESEDPADEAGESTSEAEAENSTNGAEKSTPKVEATEAKSEYSFNEDWSPIPGYYHGERGWFHTLPLSPVPWSVVVFVPATNTDSYMTNLFLINSATIAVTLLAIVAGLFLLQRIVDTGELRRKSGVPLIIESRLIVLFASVFVPVVMLGYWLGISLERADPPISQSAFSILLASVAGLTCLLWGSSQFTEAYLRENKARPLPARVERGATVLTLIFVGMGLALIAHLAWVSRVPVTHLQWYYNSNDTLTEARLHEKRIELEQVALTRYPNSITRHRIDPLALIPGLDEAQKDMLRSAETVALPDDVGTFNELTRNTSPRTWVERHFLPWWAPASSDEQGISKYPRTNPGLRYYLSMTAIFAALVLVWLWFNQRILAVRLFGSSGLLEHLNDCAGRKSSGNLHRPNKNLVLDLSNSPGGGNSLGILLQRLKKAQGSVAEIDSLATLCPLLKRASESDNPFPCMKIKVSPAEDLQSLELWDLESCLVRAKQRALLLQLIQELKSLCAAGEIGKLKIYLRFHTLERLLLKSNSLVAPASEDEGLTPQEYAAWAECLVDFRVELPDDIVEPASKNFIERESRDFPLLEELTENISNNAKADPGKSVNERRWFNLRDWQKNPSEWASINAILLTAGAMYRSKWEACSNAEKLALYHLALHKRINPSNSEMLEQLALEGLIVVHQGRIRIVNNSFAYFVRHAEDAETLKELVESGEAGAWRDYRLPITLLVLIAIGAVSMLSGNSLYVIAASVLGLLGTLGTLTNSARLIRENLSR
jgi:hypothetical protein